MNTTLITILVLLFAVAGLFIWIYNRFVKLRQRRRNAFSDIDVQLKLRHDLIPNLVNTVKGYAKHEDKVLTEVTEARASAMRASGGDIEGRAAAESMLGGAMMRLMAVAESYPDLKASPNFQQLQSELSDVENKIAAARRFFNNATSEFNTAIQQFPAVIIANMFGFKEKPFFELSEAESAAVQKTPEVKF